MFRNLFLISLITFSSFSPNTHADIGYSDSELKQLHLLEQNTVLPNDIYESINQASKKNFDYKIESLKIAKEWKDKLSSDNLSPALDINQTSNPLAKPSGILVFVSLTMPRSSLIALLKQSEELQIPLIIQGVLPGGFPLTMQHILNLLNSEQPPINNGFAISNEWFHQFNIKKVPAFVVVKDGHCFPDSTCGESDFDIVYGNVSMYEALDVLKTGDNGIIVEQHLDSLKRE